MIDYKDPDKPNIFYQTDSQMPKKKKKKKKKKRKKKI